MINEKAKSKAQQRFMGMVHAAQKGDLKNPPKSIKDAAKSMKKKDATDFASTKHKELPEKMKKEEIEETTQNVVFTESMTRARFVNENMYWNKPEDSEMNGYESENWTLQEGDKVIFDLMGMHEEWKDDEESYPIAVKHEGEKATVISQATASAVGERDYEYYDIQFEDGEELYAVSGYHLLDV